ncbi:MAG: YxeA family protein, partial [Lachnospiraceae bacterium]|nr:YxeA family protein [Lachnospiraceae bacterium]
MSEKEWYNSLAVVLTYSDNEEVTKLYVKKDSEAAYTQIEGELGTENGKDGAGNTRYQYIFTDLTEGEHTYTFKAVDAAGKETEAKLTAKLDQTGPSFGEATYQQGHKNLWNWIIRKDSLIITIPVTERLSGVDTVEYILTPDDSTADTIAGTAKVSGSQSAGYMATISVAPDFKGTVKITGSDKAGNMAGEKTIGTDGNGINGVIVEDNAPQITVLADRLPSEPETTRPEGTALLDTPYDNAPGLVVQLTDDGMGYGITGEGGTGDGSLIASG